MSDAPDAHIGRSVARSTTTFDAAALVAYSRRGNFHSDPTEAAKLGLGGLLAQGMQVAGPAYGMALAAWGEDFLASGSMDLRFVGMTHADETIETTLTIPATPGDGDNTRADETAAEVTVTNTTTGATAVVGRFTRPDRPR